MNFINDTVFRIILFVSSEVYRQQKNCANTVVGYVIKEKSDKSEQQLSFARMIAGPVNKVMYIS